MLLVEVIDIVGSGCEVLRCAQVVVLNIVFFFVVIVEIESRVGIVSIII